MKYKCTFCGAATDEAHELGTVTVHTCDACKKAMHRHVDYQCKNEQWRKDTIVCPHCNHQYDSDYSFNHATGEHVETVCEACGKKFDLEIHAVRYYHTRRSICEMDKEESV